MFSLLLEFLMVGLERRECWDRGMFSLLLEFLMVGLERLFRAVSLPEPSNSLCFGLLVMEDRGVLESERERSKGPARCGEGVESESMESLRFESWTGVSPDPSEVSHRCPARSVMGLITASLKPPGSWLGESRDSSWSLNLCCKTFSGTFLYSASFSSVFDLWPPGNSLGDSRDSSWILNLCCSTFSGRVAISSEVCFEIIQAKFGDASFS